MCRPDGARVMWLLRIFYKGVAPLELVIYDFGFLINEVVFLLQSSSPKGRYFKNEVGGFRDGVILKSKIKGAAPQELDIFESRLWI